MTPRQRGIAALALAGAATGVALQRMLPAATLALPGLTSLLLAGGLAVAVPVALGSVGSGGNHRAMLRLWTACGALGVLLTCAGLAAAGLALAQAGGGRLPWLPLAAGTGLLAGLGLVKLALRRSAAA